MEGFNRLFLNTFGAFLILGLVTPNKPILIPQRPIVILHGAGASCKSWFYEGLAEQLNGDCLEYGGGYKSLEPYLVLADKACQLLNELIGKNPKRFSHGLYIWAISNGGLVTRQMLLTCPTLQKFVRRIVFGGVPHLGVSKSGMPILRNIKEVLKDKKYSTIFGYVYNTVTGKHQTRVDVPENINQDIGSPFIKALAAHETTRRSLELPRLELVINFSSKKEFVVPWTSALFGAEYNPQTDHLTPFSETDAFKRNYIGLSKLYEQGRFMNCIVDGVHGDIELSEENEAIRSLVADDCAFDPKVFRATPIGKLYQICLQMKIVSHPRHTKVQCDPTANKFYRQFGGSKRLKGFKMHLMQP